MTFGGMTLLQQDDHPRPDVRGDPAGRLCVFAQLDRALTVKRLRDGRRAKAARGKASGSYPLGHTRDGEDDREQAVLSAVRTLLQRGDTLDEVAAPQPPTEPPPASRPALDPPDGRGRRRPRWPACRPHAGHL